MSMYEVGTVSGAVNQSKVTGVSTGWSQTALGIQQGSILAVYRNGSTDLYAIKSVDSDVQLTLSRNISTAFSGASYGIITSETASTSDFANQLASAFSLWRSVVSGWSSALTSGGNITLTDPMTGTSVTVPAIKGMAKTAGGNNLTGTQSIDSDDSGVILGKNGDIGLIKKSGTWGKLMVGHSTRFSVVRSDNDRIAATDSQAEIMGIDGNGDAFFIRNINAARSLYTQSIELSFTTPYIDFHYGNSSSDYSGRIIQDAEDQLSITGSNLRLEKSLRVAGNIQTPSGTVQASGSDIRIKYDINPAASGAVDRIATLGVCEFRMKNDDRLRRGFIAQQVDTVDGIYTFSGGTVENDGGMIEILNVDQTAIVADLVTVVQELLQRISLMEKHR